MAPRSSFDLDSLLTAVPAVFDQAQSSAATHKKNCVALYKLQNVSASVVEAIDKGKKGAEIRLVGEKAFTDVFTDMLNRVLVVKKGTPTADRIVKFVGVYVKFFNEKSSEKSSDDEETPSSRFIARLLKFLLKGFPAKNKNVRYRCINLISEVVLHLGEIEEDLYAELRAALIERLCDKEPLIRAHCVAALSKIAASEDPDDLESDQRPIVTSLLTSLFYDPAAEVRRAALIHMPFTPATLPALLTRCRDVDAVTRKLVYSIVLLRLNHPKQLTIAQREQVVQQGLGDREEAVRVAAAKLLGSWVDLCEGNLTSFIQLFDVRTIDISLDALKSVFITRAEVVREIEFDDSFWSGLLPETALLARAFVEHCIDSKDEAKLEATLPVVTALAFHLQTQYNSFLELLQDAHEAELLEDSIEDDEESEAREEKLADAEFVMVELLQLALHLDYADEIGRRKMFGVVREILGHPELPEPLIRPCVCVLNTMSPNERDLVRVVVEVINELRDSDSDPGTAGDNMPSDADMTSITTKTMESTGRNRRQLTDMDPDEKAQADALDLRCLNLCIAVLERVNGSFEENSVLEGILADLIVPSVKRKELALREKGLVSLGLCCLISKNMAMSSFKLFLSQIKSVPESLRLKVLQVTFDIMMTYEKDLLGGAEDFGQQVISFLMQVLEAEDSKPVQALICLGLSKLMLFGLITDERVLTSLVLAYISPVTADNQELRQCLAYFLPMYCYSSPANQCRMQSIFMSAYDLVARVFEDLEEEQDMISPLQFGYLLIDWTDPSKIINIPCAQEETLPVHLNIAVDIMKSLYDSKRSPDDKKTLCQLLGKLTLPKECDEDSLYALYILIVSLIELCPFEDIATGKIFLRFKANLEKQYSTSLRDYDERVCFHNDAYKDIFEFIGVTRPRERRFAGRQPTNTRGDIDGGVPSKSKRGLQQRRSEKAEDSSEDKSSNSSSSNSEDERPIKPGPPRSRRRRSASKAKPATPPLSDDDDNDAKSVSENIKSDDNSKENLPQPSTPTRKKGAKRIHTPTKTPSMASPAPKRQNRSAAAKNGKGKPTDNKAPLANATNKRGKSISQQPLAQRARDRPSIPKGQIAQPHERDEDNSVSEDSQDDSEEVSDASVPLRLPPLIKEKIGWSDSSDI